jgi:hypothetical protein
MDVKQRYLSGDIYSLENVNKIVPRKTELGLLLQQSKYLISFSSKLILEFPIFLLQKFKSGKIYLE